MKRQLLHSKTILSLLSSALFTIFFCQQVMASDSTTGWYNINGSSPFLILQDTDLDPLALWYLWNDDPDLPSGAVGIGYWDVDKPGGANVSYPFVAEIDSAENSLYIANNKKIGIFTNTPAEELHIVAPWGSGGIFWPNAATLRLTGAGIGIIGTLTQWDINGRVTSFGIEDVNAGHEVFRIEGGAAADTLVLENTGGVSSSWIGSETTGDGLKNMATLSANNTQALLSSDVGFALINERENFQWNFRTAESAQGFMATKNGSGGPELEIKNATNDYSQVSLRLGNGAGCSSTGQWYHASSREYKDNIKVLSGDEAMAAFEELQPVSYTFKKDAKKEPVLGFIAEDVPELVAAEERKSINALEIVALVTKVVQEQQEQIKEQQAMIQAQQMAILELQEFQASITAQRPVQAVGYTSRQPEASRGTARQL